MSTILYLKNSPMGERSSSIATADAFIDSYNQIHTDDSIVTINIFKKSLPAFDFEAASAKYKILHNKEHSQEDRQIWDEIVSVIDEFKSADKYVMAVPMWNFSIPYRLKQYIDIIIQPGYTFSVNEDGSYKGLVGDKPIFVAYARGGEYPEGTEQQTFDMQKKYLELILGFIGFADIRTVVVEPTLAGGPDVAKQRLDAAIEKAKQMAKEF